MRITFSFLFLLNAVIAYSQVQVSITDIQTTTTGTSPYDGQMVQTIGVVTASAESDNLGFVYIQEPGVTEWGGIPLYGNIGLADLKIGDEVAVQGTVMENFGVTQLSSITSLQVVDSGLTVLPIELDPSHFSTASFLDIEKYEGLFVRLTNGVDSVYVVNPDVGFGDYRIGTDTANINNGCLVLAGRQSSSTSSSLNVSYVTDSVYFDVDGMMNVPLIEVMHGDAFPWVQGVVTYGFSNYRLLPRNNADFGQTSTGLVSSEFKTIAVYPNPSNGQFNIDLSMLHENGLLEVYAMDGRMILSRNVPPSQLTLNLSEFGTGVYHLRIVTENVVFGQRLVVR